jgi:hypothetical protein
MQGAGLQRQTYCARTPSYDILLHEQWMCCWDGYPCLQELLPNCSHDKLLCCEWQLCCLRCSGGSHEKLRCFVVVLARALSSCMWWRGCLRPSCCRDWGKLVPYCLCCCCTGVGAGAACAGAIEVGFPACPSNGYVHSMLGQGMAT